MSWLKFHISHVFVHKTVLHTCTANARFLLDRDEVLQLGGDPEKLTVLSDRAAVRQDDFLRIGFANIKVLSKGKGGHSQPTQQL